MAWGNDRIRDLVIRTILGESDGSQPGMVSVANVMKNRASSGAWGDPNGGLTRAITAHKQFSMWNNDDPKLQALAASVKAIPTSDPRYQRAAAVADGVFGDQIPDNTNGATFYHTPNVSPSWSQGQTPVATIGGHLFYRLPLTSSNTGGTAVTSPSMVGVGGTAAPGTFVYGGESTQDPGVDVRHLEPIFAARITKLQADAAAAGIKTHLTSGYRDNVSQAGDYARLGAQHLAAAPGQSYHQFGRAVDLVADNPAQQQELIALADQPGRGIAAGAHFQTPDRVHFQAVEGKTAPLQETPGTTPAPAPLGQGGIGSEGHLPLGTASPGQPAVSTVVPNPADVPAASAQTVSATAPAKPAPGSDKFSVIKGMTTGTGHNPMLYTAANLGNLFGGASPPSAPPAASAPAIKPPIGGGAGNVLEAPTGTPASAPSAAPLPPPTVPAGASVNKPPGSPASSIVSNWGATTPNDLSTIPAAAPQGLPAGIVNGEPAATQGGPSMGFPGMTNPFGQQPPPDQVSQIPGSLLAAGQNLIKLLFPTA